MQVPSAGSIVVGDRLLTVDTVALPALVIGLLSGAYPAFYLS